MNYLPLLAQGFARVKDPMCTGGRKTGLHITAGVNGAAGNTQEHPREITDPSKGGQDFSYPLSQLPSKDLQNSASLQVTLNHTNKLC